MTQKAKIKETKEVIEKLYRVNSFISGHYITKLKKIDYEGICNINELLGEVIKQFRAINL